MVTRDEVAEEGAAGTWEHIVDDVEDQESNDEDGNNAWAGLFCGVVTEIRGVADEKHGVGKDGGGGSGRGGKSVTIERSRGDRFGKRGHIVTTIENTYVHQHP